MFAAQGFIPITRISDLISGIAGDMLYAEAIERRKVSWTEFWRDPETGRAELLMSRTLLEAWLIAKVMGHFDVYASSPSGTVLLVDSWVLEHQEQLDWYEWGWPDTFTYEGELMVPMQHLRDGFNPLSRFLFVDLYTGTISVSKRREWLTAEEERTGDDLASLASALSPLDGWSICFKIGDIPASVDELLRRLDVSLPRLNLGGQQNSTRRGRPQKVPKIAEAYLSKFPDGHGQMQREEVRRVIKPIVGEHFSLDTLDRAIRLTKSPNFGKSMQ